jgi:hypothetical protein
MENNQMTVFYKLKTLEIVMLAEGIQSFNFFADMDKDIVEMVYGKVIMETDLYAIGHRREFELVKNKNGELILQMKESAKQAFQKYL